MSDVEDRQQAEQKWAAQANKVLKDAHSGGWSPWLSMGRYGMAIDSVPLQMYDSRVSGGLGDRSAMDNRMKLYQDALKAAQGGGQVPEAWTKKYGDPTL